ncbi:MAG: DNA-binding response regulator [Zunongwangia sp.]|jgi:two-component system response regulator NreC|uniref:DNA-binding response regulator n=2 Tax=Zunongwangia profunda TaxID=398743 RepID=A0A3D5J3I9_9FLAO|nr:response regulator transcription factor [Zunongwangia profunda]MAC64592.1 DNA-binding response regulator [Flavobacteriaceae bacterium]MAO38566.1 DNA-binding response regulator [Zunongwangia sp.]MAG89088.1 DNA-binding response regulator [Flavobacteriaceae bacterium]MAS71886.1 DNA-binding response regulator [Zunongwangia sp.]MCC4230809.1 response regulator transcription factor [Zunongwangia profunda]|tara:strand:- start:3618 stop:4241 length:624 start_codon:yes stop_codon:yes gene_type:complete
MKAIKIVLVDDHSLFTEGLMQILDAIDDLQVIATFRDGETMLKSDEIHKADVLLLDINLPGNSGISIAEKMKPYFASLKIICLSMLFEKNILDKLKFIGVAGYLPKFVHTNELIEAIRKVRIGETAFYEEHTKAVSNIKVWTSDFKLTNRELEILQLIKDGKSTKEISEILHRSQFTIETHRKNMIRKLNLKNSSGLLHFAMKNLPS